jgi:hypothetical protein
MTIGKGKRPSAPKRDFMQVGRAIVEQAMGEQMDGSPLPIPPKVRSNERSNRINGHAPKAKCYAVTR